MPESREKVCFRKCVWINFSFEPHPEECDICLKCDCTKGHDVLREKQFHFHECNYSRVADVSTVWQTAQNDLVRGWLWYRAYLFQVLVSRNTEFPACSNYYEPCIWAGLAGSIVYLGRGTFELCSRFLVDKRGSAAAEFAFPLSLLNYTIMVKKQFHINQRRYYTARNNCSLVGSLETGPHGQHWYSYQLRFSSMRLKVAL